MREEGYYWIKYSEYENNINPQWGVMYWNPEFNAFHLNDEFEYPDGDCIEIDEKRIVRGE